MATYKGLNCKRQTLCKELTTDHLLTKNVSLPSRDRVTKRSASRPGTHDLRHGDNRKNIRSFEGFVRLNFFPFFTNMTYLRCFFHLFPFFLCGYFQFSEMKQSFKQQQKN